MQDMCSRIFIFIFNLINCDACKEIYIKFFQGYIFYFEIKILRPPDLFFSTADIFILIILLLTFFFPFHLSPIYIPRYPFNATVQSRMQRFFADIAKSPVYFAALKGKKKITL